MPNWQYLPVKPVVASLPQMAISPPLPLPGGLRWPLGTVRRFWRRGWRSSTLGKPSAFASPIDNSQVKVDVCDWSD